MLELTAWDWSKGHGYVTVEGMVTNISGGPLKAVQAVAIFTDKDGGFVTSDDAVIEYNPILAGQSSPFKVMARWNPAMESCRLEFKRMFGPELPTKHSWKK